MNPENLDTEETIELPTSYLAILTAIATAIMTIAAVSLLQSEALAHESLLVMATRIGRIGLGAFLAATILIQQFRTEFKDMGRATIKTLRRLAPESPAFFRPAAS